MPLSLAQKTIIENSRRFTVASCGRRFGKTTVAVRQICFEARIPNREIYYVSPSYRMSKTIVFKKLKEKLLNLRWVKKIHETELSFLLKNNTTISLKGADNYDSLRGVGLDFLVMDEAADIDPAAFYEVLRPALSDRQGRALILGTPKGFNWFKDVFDLAEEFPEEWASFQYTTLDGGQVSAEEIESARRDLDERTFNQEYLGTFQTFSGRVFYAFERANNLKPYNKELPREIHIGLDFNVDPMSAVIGVKLNDSEFHIIDEIRIFGSNTDELVQEIRTRYPNKSIVCYPDPAGAQRKTSAGGRTDHTILRTANFRVLAPNSHNAIRDGVNAVNAKLRSSSGITSLFIDPRCKYVIECLEKQTYKSGTSIPDKDSGFDHMNDALRYMIDYLYPIRSPIHALPIRTWGHKLARV
jgi:hypothetical protein